MKTLLLAFVAATFAFAGSLQAGDNADKAKAASSCSDQAKGCCAKDACCAAKAGAAKAARKADVSVKGATLLVRR
ncbi:MAG TPA: hypothetical protein VNU68_21365 [Verrucomicrobiae bacterium]|jgi:hypothetical protein|nr:hypothetical protein [Verrucomicrobiae bacterium]